MCDWMFVQITDLTDDLTASPPVRAKQSQSECLLSEPVLSPGPCINPCTLPGSGYASVRFCHSPPLCEQTARRGFSRPFVSSLPGSVHRVHTGTWSAKQLIWIQTGGFSSPLVSPMSLMGTESRHTGPGPDQSISGQQDSSILFLPLSDPSVLRFVYML